MHTPRAEADAAEAGLCARCRHARVHENVRRSRFWRCGRAGIDRAFSRYPPLPVQVCPGHEAGRPQTSSGD